MLSIIWQLHAGLWRSLTSHRRAFAFVCVCVCVHVCVCVWCFSRNPICTRILTLPLWRNPLSLFLILISDSSWCGGNGPSNKEATRVGKIAFGTDLKNLRLANDVLVVIVCPSSDIAAVQRDPQVQHTVKWLSRSAVRAKNSGSESVPFWKEWVCEQ